MKITEFFDPDNIEHLKAYKELWTHAYWPKDFIPVGTEFSSTWQVELAFKMADKWVEYKLDLEEKE